ncbi:MAG: M1 family metallopeptidase [Chloroflexia bacterium]|nr:M1 family metallopeptidase [Chloroflexia bacterium]
MNPKHLLLWIFILNLIQIQGQPLSHKSTGSNYDLKYHYLQFEVDPAVYYIKGKVTSYFKMLSESNSISFDLSDELTIDSVLFHDQKLTYTHSEDVLTANFPSNIPPDQLDSVSVFYEGSPAQSGGFGAFIKTLMMGFQLSGPYQSPMEQGIGGLVNKNCMIKQTPLT